MNVNIRPDHESAASLYNRLPDWAKREVSTSLDRFAYIMGVVEEYKPVKMAEIGVSAGTLSAALLLKSVEYSEESLLYGIDFSPTAYYDDEIPIANTVLDLYPHLVKHLSIHTEKTSLDADSIIQDKLDMVYIDANHCHPWASIDCLSLLPHLTDNAVIGFHDTAVTYVRPNAGHFTFSSLQLDGFEETGMDPHGSGFKQYDGDADKVLEDILTSLSLPWEVQIDESFVERLIDNVGRNFGSNWRSRYERKLRYLAPFYNVHFATQKALHEQDLDAYRQSTSWKVTAPLRSLSKWIKG